MLLPIPRLPYQVGGSLPSTATTYVERQADKVLFQGLLAGEFCYVFNSRQMGKSSLRVRTMARLQQAGVQSLAIDLNSIGSYQVTIDQWYAAIAAIITKGFNLAIDIGQWWRDHDHLPFVARLAELIDNVLLVEVSHPIVILMDEIDMVSQLRFATDDFFVLVRTYSERRVDCPVCRRLTFAFFGVTPPDELIANETRPPFNIGHGIAIRGFSRSEAAQLAVGLQGQIPHPQTVLDRIFDWTAGQPFLTQKLCQLVIESAQTPTAEEVTSEVWIDDLVHTRILAKWETQDEPEHLRTIRDRLLQDEVGAGSRLDLYQKLLEAQVIATDGSSTQTDLLSSGLVSLEAGQLHIKNRIYRQVFNLEWVTQQLNDLRPHSVMLQH